MALHCFKVIFAFFAPKREALALQEEMAQGLAVLERITQRVTEIQDGLTGSFRIATNGAMAINLLPALIVAYQHKHSDIKIDIIVRNPHQIAN